MASRQSECYQDSCVQYCVYALVLYIQYCITVSATF
jgi:hypothetical protein